MRDVCWLASWGTKDGEEVTPRSRDSYINPVGKRVPRRRVLERSSVAVRVSMIEIRSRRLKIRLTKCRLVRPARRRLPPEVDRERRRAPDMRRNARLRVNSFIILIGFTEIERLPDDVRLVCSFPHYLCLFARSSHNDRFPNWNYEKDSLTRGNPLCPGFLV